MKLSVIQFCPEFEEKAKNISRINEFIKNINSDILVFPELATTGYFFLNKNETSKFAEEADGEFVNHISSLASKYNKIICSGFIEEAGDKIFNSAAVVFPDCKLNRVYRKTHLFYKERFCFDEGDSGYFVIDYKDMDIKIGTMICYDWRFPEASRTLGIKGADIILCPSNLVTDVWHLAMPARALENKVYLAVSNRTGTEIRGSEELLFKGLSAIYSYNGKPLATAGKEDEIVITAEIYPEKTRDKSFNEFNDIFKDRRPEMYL